MIKLTFPMLMQIRPKNKKKKKINKIALHLKFVHHIHKIP